MFYTTVTTFEIFHCRVRAAFRDCIIYYCTNFVRRGRRAETRRLQLFTTFTTDSINYASVYKIVYRDMNASKTRQCCFQTKRMVIHKINRSTEAHSNQVPRSNQGNLHFARQIKNIINDRLFPVVNARVQPTSSIENETMKYISYAARALRTSTISINRRETTTPECVNTNSE